jgi:hypothetical protein
MIVDTTPTPGRGTKKARPVKRQDPSGVAQGLVWDMPDDHWYF